MVGYEGFYQVSNFGFVRSVECRVASKGGTTRLRRGRVLKPGEEAGGYLHVGLCREGKQITLKVYKIVLEAFVGLCPVGMECCHGNGDKTDNRLSNLRWGTKTENAKDRVTHGTDPAGERNPRAKLTDAKVMMIYLRAKAGEMQTLIAKDFGVSKTTINHILCRRTWAHITRGI